MVDMFRWWQQQGGEGFTPTPSNEPASIVHIKNDSGSDLTRFSALAITDVFPDPDDNENSFANGPLLTGDTPTASTAPGNFCVMLEPAKDGVVVPAAIAGVTVVKLNVVTATDTTCGVGTTSVLQSGKQGAQILWKQTGTGTKWAIIRLGATAGGFDEILCELTAALTTSTASINVDNISTISGSDPRTDPTSSAETLLVYNARTPKWDSDDEAECIAKYNYTTGHWEFNWCPCAT